MALGFVTGDGRTVHFRLGPFGGAARPGGDEPFQFRASVTSTSACRTNAQSDLSRPFCDPLRPHAESFATLSRGPIVTVALTRLALLTRESESSLPRYSATDRERGVHDRTPYALPQNGDFRPVQRLDANPYTATGNRKTPGRSLPGVSR